MCPFRAPSTNDGPADRHAPVAFRDCPRRTFDRPGPDARTLANPVESRRPRLARAVLYGLVMSTYNKIVRRNRLTGRLDTLFIATIGFITASAVQLFA